MNGVNNDLQTVFNQTLFILTLNDEGSAEPTVRNELIDTSGRLLIDTSTNTLTDT